MLEVVEALSESSQNPTRSQEWVGWQRLQSNAARECFQSRLNPNFDCPLLGVFRS